MPPAARRICSRLLFALMLAPLLAIAAPLHVFADCLSPWGSPFTIGATNAHGVVLR